MRALSFARTTGNVLIRWQSPHSKWEGCPLDDHNIKEAMRDPAFYEFFVYNSNCDLTDTISKAKSLCNGSRAQFHSLILDTDNEPVFNIELNNSKPGDIIILQEPPLAINVVIDDPKITENNANDWRHLSLDKEK